MSPKNPALAVLVVEDVDEMRLLLEQVLLGISGIKVSGLARNGSEARLEVARRRPDVVLLDEILPGESGHDLLREFTLDGISVILMTSMENPSEVIPPQALGRMAKPGWKSLEEDQARIKNFIFQQMKRSQA